MNTCYLYCGVKTRKKKIENLSFILSFVDYHVNITLVIINIVALINPSLFLKTLSNTTNLKLNLY
jgi:fumarate reductase subunit C